MGPERGRESERERRQEKEKEREWEREVEPPAGCPDFVYNKKPLFDVAVWPSAAHSLPQDVLWLGCDLIN